MSRTKVPLSGPLLPHWEGLRADLIERGYAPSSLCKFEYLLGRLSG